jgi:hypothetical protein
MIKDSTEKLLVCSLAFALPILQQQNKSDQLFYVYVVVYKGQEIILRRERNTCNGNSSHQENLMVLKILYIDGFFLFGLIICNIQIHFGRTDERNCFGIPQLAKINIWINTCYK